MSILRPGSLWLLVSSYGHQIMTSGRMDFWGCPGVPVHGGIPIVFISIHGVVTQFVNVSFLCVPVHEDTTGILSQKL